MPAPAEFSKSVLTYPVTVAEMRADWHFGTKVIPWRALPLVLDPDSHARLKACRFSLRIEAQAKRVAVVIANDPLGLPGGERSDRSQFGDAGFDRACGAVPHNARRFSHRETVEMVFAHIEREPLLAGRLDHQDRLARAN